MKKIGFADIVEYTDGIVLAPVGSHATDLFQDITTYCGVCGAVINPEYQHECSWPDPPKVTTYCGVCGLIIDPKYPHKCRGELQVTMIYCPDCGIPIRPSYPHECDSGKRHSYQISLNLHHVKLLEEIEQLKEEIALLKE